MVSKSPCVRAKNSSPSSEEVLVEKIASIRSDSNKPAVDCPCGGGHTSQSQRFAARAITILILAALGTHQLSTNAPLPNVALRLHWLVLRLRPEQGLRAQNFPVPAGSNRGKEIFAPGEEIGMKRIVFVYVVLAATAALLGAQQASQSSPYTGHFESAAR